MNYVIGFIIWLVIGVVLSMVVHRGYRATGTAAPVAVALGTLGAFVGGMLAVSQYVYHDPSPLRIGGLLGAVLGALFFTFIYQYAARYLT
ncbi:MAG TPA: hypothetical protein VFQ38_11130 [Longimicrobiales bacterium]|nr:hypothetical protein [Longimicrobiales bacterium]